MDGIREILNQGWIGTVIGFFGIVIGVILAYFFRPRARIAAQINTLQLLGRNSVLPTDIEFLFRGNNVPNVTMSRIAIWNKGNTTIRGDQIVGSDPLCIITSDESTILDTIILTRTRQVNAFACIAQQQKRNQVECRFDYLEPDDGALIQLIHTGNDKVEIKGSLRGIPKGVSVVGNPYKEKQQEQTRLSPRGSRRLALVFIVSGMLLIGYGTVVPLSNPEKGSEILDVGLALMLVGLIIFGAMRRMPPAQLSTEITSNESKRSFWSRWTK